MPAARLRAAIASASAARADRSTGGPARGFAARTVRQVLVPAARSVTPAPGHGSRRRGARRSLAGAAPARAGRTRGHTEMPGDRDQHQERRQGDLPAHEDQRHRAAGQHERPQ